MYKYFVQRKILMYYENIMKTARIRRYVVAYVIENNLFMLHVVNAATLQNRDMQ